jgi:hypothetical protein
VSVLWMLPLAMFILSTLIITFPLSHIMSFLERRSVNLWMVLSLILQIFSVTDLICDIILLFDDFLDFASPSHPIFPGNAVVTSPVFGLSLQALRVFYTIIASSISLFVGKLLYAYVAHNDPSKPFNLCQVFRHLFMQKGVWAAAAVCCLVWKILPLLLMKLFLLGVLIVSMSRKNGEKIMYRLSHTIDMFEVLQMSDCILSGIPLFWISALEMYRVGMPQNKFNISIKFWFMLRFVKVCSCFLNSVNMMYFAYFNVLGFSGRGFGQRQRRYDSEYSLEKDNFTDRSSVFPHQHHHHRVDTNLTLTWSDQESEGIVRAQLSPKNKDIDREDTIWENETMVG